MKRISGLRSAAGARALRRTVVFAAWVIALTWPAALVRAASPSFPLHIASITVCDPQGRGGVGDCPAGTFDTHQIVLSPDGKSINKYVTSGNLGGLGGISDEHQSVFAPGMLNGNADYLFFVASRSTVNSDTGLVVLSGGSGPDPNTGQWRFDLPWSDGYGFYNTPPSLLTYFGQIFLSPVGRDCPTVSSNLPQDQDQTFDLNYAVPGSIVQDPTTPNSHLLMIYEGTNTCFGTTGGARSKNFYSTIGVATSIDFGKTWPTYRYGLDKNGNLKFPLPFPQNSKQGPERPFGATGSAVCEGNNCHTTPSPDYGRYAAISPHVALNTIMKTGNPLKKTIGDADPSAFVDDASANPAQYLYEVHNYAPGTYNNPPLPDNPDSDLMIARAALGTSPLQFVKWDGQAFSTQAGVGGRESPILPSGPYEQCGQPNQKRDEGSIDYVEDTSQYLLTFVCASPSDPVLGPLPSGAKPTPGAAWFYSTSSDLSNQANWSAPQEIGGTWAVLGNHCDYKGWYPTFMSLGQAPGHLTRVGYAFYLWGCTGANTPAPGRRYSSRSFAMTLTTAP